MNRYNNKSDSFKKFELYDAGEYTLPAMRLTTRCSGAAAVNLSSFIGRRRPTERER